MSIEALSPGAWRLDVNLKKNGREYRKRETFNGSKGAAVARSFELKRDLKARAKAETSSLKSSEIVTFGQALEWYFRVKKDCLVSETAFNRMKDDLGHVRLTEIKPKFKEYWLCLRRTRSRQTGEFLSASTVNHYTVMAKAALITSAIKYS